MSTPSDLTMRYGLWQIQAKLDPLMWGLPDPGPDQDVFKLPDGSPRKTMALTLLAYRWIQELEDMNADDQQALIAQIHEAERQSIIISSRPTPSHPHTHEDQKHHTHAEKMTLEKFMLSVLQTMRDERIALFNQHSTDLAGKLNQPGLIIPPAFNSIETAQQLTAATQDALLNNPKLFNNLKEKIRQMQATPAVGTPPTPIPHEEIAADISLLHEKVKQQAIDNKHHHAANYLHHNPYQHTPDPNNLVPHLSNPISELLLTMVRHANQRDDQVIQHQQKAQQYLKFIQPQLNKLVNKSGLNLDELNKIAQPDKSPAQDFRSTIPAVSTPRLER